MEYVYRMMDFSITEKRGSLVILPSPEKRGDGIKFPYYSGLSIFLYPVGFYSFSHHICKTLTLVRVNV
jgi:hypothetical protein